VTRCALLADNGCGWAIADLALHRSAGVLNLPLPTHSRGRSAPRARRRGHRRAAHRRSGPCRRAPCRASGVVESPRSGPRPLAATARGRRRGPLPPRHREDHLHLRQHRHAQGRLPGQRGARARRRVARRGHAPARRRAPPLPAAARRPCSTTSPACRAAPLAGAACVLPSTRLTGVSHGGVDVARCSPASRATGHSSMMLVPELLRVLLAAIGRGWRARVAALHRRRRRLVSRRNCSSRPRQPACRCTRATASASAPRWCALNTPAAPARQRRASAAARPRARRFEGQIHVRGAVMPATSARPLPRRTRRSPPATSASSMTTASCTLRAAQAT
jgi:hypothetical protein